MNVMTRYVVHIHERMQATFEMGGAAHLMPVSRFLVAAREGSTWIRTIDISVRRGIVGEKKMWKL